MEKKTIAIAAIAAIIIIAAAAAVILMNNGNGGDDKSSIQIAASDITVSAGDSAELKVTVTPSKYQKDLVITPANTDIYSFDNGIVHGLKKGKSTISLTVDDVKKTVNVNVTGIRVTDHNGKVVELDKPAERVVVYTKYMAEAFVVLGATDKVVATSDTVLKDTNIGSYYAGKASVGSSSPQSADVAIANRADLVILYDGDASVYDASKIPVLEIGASKLDEIHADITALGLALGMPEKASKVLEWFDKYYKIILDKAPTTDKTIVNTMESWSSTKFRVMGDTSTPGTLMRLAGGNNPFEGGYVYVDVSTIIETNPDIYYTIMYNAQWNDEGRQIQFDAITSRAGWENITAIKNKEVYLISNDLMGGLRSVIGGMYFLSMLNKDCSYDVEQLMDEFNKLGGTSFNTHLVYKMS